MKIKRDEIYEDEGGSFYYLDPVTGEEVPCDEKGNPSIKHYAGASASRAQTGREVKVCLSCKSELAPHQFNCPCGSMSFRYVKR